MSALTTIFNHLYVYLYCMLNFIFGGEVLLKEIANPTQREILLNCGEVFYKYYPDLVSLDSNGLMAVNFEAQPILILIVGVFALGSIIALVRRLVR